VTTDLHHFALASPSLGVVDARRDWRDLIAAVSQCRRRIRIRRRRRVMAGAQDVLREVALEGPRGAWVFRC
jgi:hypothetical protein